MVSEEGYGHEKMVSEGDIDTKKWLVRGIWTRKNG